MNISILSKNFQPSEKRENPFEKFRKVNPSSERKVNPFEEFRKPSSERKVNPFEKFRKLSSERKVNPFEKFRKPSSERKVNPFEKFRKPSSERKVNPFEKFRKSSEKKKSDVEIMAGTILKPEISEEEKVDEMIDTLASKHSDVERKALIQKLYDSIIINARPLLYLVSSATLVAFSIALILSSCLEAKPCGWLCVSVKPNGTRVSCILQSL